MSTKDDKVIALAVLAGCQPVYYDYGHPERATSRLYWTAPLRQFATAYGATRADCCRRWLIEMGYKDLLP